jgi:hypothetical protein
VSLPIGDIGVFMIEMKAYFDESGECDISPVFCMAGFIIEREAARQMSERWQKMLDAYRLPMFHMTDCANGAPPFDSLTMDERIAAEKEAISIIRDTITYGFAVSLKPREFSKSVPRSPEIGSPYSLCVHTCFTGVRGWANHTNFAGKISYIFEEGHRSAGEANGIMRRIFYKPEMRAEHRYISHAFADKCMVLPLQAADLIAWQWFSENKRQIERTRPNPRKDFQELMIKPMESGAKYHAIHFTPKLLADISHPVLMNEYPLTYPWR